ncbi:MAG: hypothetical protein BWY67_02407 [Bacteroidetes bacterium ADurb.Bin397]|nr:MAG: hypothetical protein BWY67_02407 [Bacteroidetes bacterium ADurb.Bin397]
MALILPAFRILEKLFSLALMFTFHNPDEYPPASNTESEIIAIAWNRSGVISFFTIAPFSKSIRFLAPQQATLLTPRRRCVA